MSKIPLAGFLAIQNHNPLNYSVFFIDSTKQSGNLMAKAVKEVKDEPLEKQLWKAADKLRKNIDAAEYKHVVLGLIFLKYISDSFEELFTKLQAGQGEYAGADPEDKDEYKAENVFFVPLEARWSFLLAKAKQPEIGKFIDAAMDAIEKENPSLKGVLPKVYARQNLDPTNLGGLIDLVGNIALGDAKARSRDVLGHVLIVPKVSAHKPTHSPWHTRYPASEKSFSPAPLFVEWIA
jgi:type I restriction-modification system DNA methylase subunit